MHGLQLALTLGTRDMLVRMDGTRFYYHLDQISDTEMCALLHQNDINREYIGAIGERLNKVLNEQERKTSARK